MLSSSYFLSMCCTKKSEKINLSNLLYHQLNYLRHLREQKYKGHFYVDPLNVGNLKNIPDVLDSSCPLASKTRKYETLFFVYHCVLSNG